LSGLGNAVLAVVEPTQQWGSGCRIPHRAERTAHSQADIPVLVVDPSHQGGNGRQITCRT
jgi:2C-methyl-D-erythritol 2,4-cyclodiphosphate synthase